MADYIVLSMRDGDFRSIHTNKHSQIINRHPNGNTVVKYRVNNRTIRAFIRGLENINDHIYTDDENHLNLLHLAAGLDSVHRESIIELFIKEGANPNCLGRSENVCNITALHLASMWGYHDTVKLLLLNGADASLRASNKYSAIDYATIFDNYVCISFLIRYELHHFDTSTSACSTIRIESSSDNESGPVYISSDDCLYLTAIDLNADEPKSRGGDHINHLQNTSRNRPSDIISVLSDISEVQEDDCDPLSEVDDRDLDLNIENRHLRLELMRLGHHAGPITNSTRMVYLKLLAMLKKQDKELTYSPRTAAKSRLNGYSVELTSIQTGKFATKQALDLEKEFFRISGSKLYHGSKQYFNYILLDPRVTKNLPEQAIEASDSDTSRMASPDCGLLKPKHVMGRVNRKFNAQLFTKFIEGIFYIGKGQKRRDFDHLHDAITGRGSVTRKKIATIRSIWDDGYGVVSLHLFHNITDKEALTREALMIETIGLDNLTNLLHGTVQFRLGWNEHQRKLLGALLLFRAYMQHLNEGERQLKRNDLRVVQSK